MAEKHDWAKLQRKIFTRWCKQKLVRRPDLYHKLNDIVTDVHDGLILIALVEELAEKKCPEKINWEKPETSRIRKVAIVNNALKFVFAQGVELKLKPSPEDIVDGKQDNILGLIWAIMSRFIKIGDDDDEESAKLNAKDALLMWCNNKCQGYPSIPSLENFKKTAKSPFHNGLALCAIIHKHRPKLIPNMLELSPSNALKNIEIAQDAAEKYFGLDKFLTPSEVSQLDESSMVIYVYEFYLGISNQRKIDLAARRISKLIKYTKENDRLREEYQQTATQYKERLSRVEEILNDRTIDNTMAGAKAKLEEFYKYKTNDKNVLLGNQLDLEALYNNLAMRLAHHQRPEFVPPTGVTLRDVEAALAHLEQVEQERSIALHRELNRQIRLAKLAEQHKSIFENLKNWCVSKEEFLKQRPIIDSASSAQLQLRLLEAFTKESATLKKTTLAFFDNITEELISQKYEDSTTISEHSKNIHDHYQTLEKMGQQRQPVLEDDLKRETYKQEVKLQYQEFARRYEVLVSQWITPKEQYLNTFPEIHSVEEANTCLSLLDIHEKECRIMGDSLVEELNKLAKQVLEASYSGDFSSYKFDHTITQDPPHEYEDPELRKSVSDKDKFIEEKWKLLNTLTETMKSILSDHLKREEVSAETRIIASNYKDKIAAIQKWVEESEIYLKDRELVHSVQEARTEVAKINIFEKQLNLMRTTKVTELTSIAQDLLSRNYSSELSSYEYEHSISKHPPFDIHDEEKKKYIEECEAWVKSKWESMANLTKEKIDIMNDHLKREDFAVETRVIASSHNDRFETISNWVNESIKFLNDREHIHSVHEANTKITQLKLFQKELSQTKDTQVQELFAIGKDLLGRSYSSTLSKYEYENTEILFLGFQDHKPELRSKIVEHEEWVTKQWEEMATLAQRKMEILEDHLKREQYAVTVRQQAQQHADMFKKLESWITEKEAYLKSRPEIKSIGDAQVQRTLFEQYNGEYAMMEKTTMTNFFSLGETVLAAKYHSELSDYVYEHTKYLEPGYDEHKPELREELESHISFAKTHQKELVSLAASLSKELDDALQRENKKEQLRLEYAHLALEFIKYAKDTSNSLSIEGFGFTLEEVQAHKTSIEKTTQEITEKADSKLSEIKGIHQSMNEIGVTENIYSSITVEELEKAHNDLMTALSARNTAYEKELARQIENDRLCREFAKVADAFSHLIIENKNNITSNKSSLEDQLAFVVKHIEALPENRSQLEAIKEWANKIEAAGISHITHTTLTFKDVEVQFEQYQKFLEAKKSMLETEIQNAKLRGITPEQYKEIEDNFKVFDKNNDGVLDRKEFTGCLYSLGEERTGKEIKALLEKYGDEKGMVSYENYKELLIHLFGDADTKEEILNSFVLINKGEKVATHEHIEAVLPQEDVSYIEETAPKTEQGWDYQQWVESVFSR